MLRRLCIAMLLPAATLGQSSGVAMPDIAGFQIDTSRVSKPDATKTLATLRHQVAIVESAALPPQVLEFFRSVPIVIDPTLEGMNGEYAQEGGKAQINARPGKWPADRAILLHELLHAY